MKNMTTKLVTVALLLALGPMAVNASTCPTSPPYIFDGRVYEVIVDDGIGWDAADEAANDLVNGGIQGHLATINSFAEDEFVDCLRLATPGINTYGTFADSELWVGGFQQPSSGEPAQGWQWINGEIISPFNTLSPYTNWRPGEPNNVGSGESHLAVGLNGNFGWNDEGNLNGIFGYVVEYGDKIIVDPEDCESGGEGCDLGGIVATFPPGAMIAPDAELTVTSMRFNGDGARCDDTDTSQTPGPKVLFGGLVTIPPYLCGSPDFIVLKTESTGVEIPDGTVFVENKTEDLLPGNFYICEDPIFQNFPTDGDPQFQDVVAWQSTIAAEMLEVDVDVGGTGLFEGSVTEVTNGCGSSKGRTRSNSYYFIGLHIDCGDLNDWAVNTAGNFDCFVALTRYKLVLLQQAVENAKPFLKNGDHKKMQKMVSNSIKLLDKGNYSDALDHVINFVAFAEAANYEIDPGFNHNGEHLMRGSNIQFMFEVKLIPYAP